MKKKRKVELKRTVSEVEKEETGLGEIGKVVNRGKMAKLQAGSKRKHGRAEKRGLTAASTA